MSGDGIKVLLVDDQEIVGQAVRNLLASESDVEFHFCNDPAQAVQNASRIRPTVILQDLVMPEVDGLTLVRFYRNNPATADTPIIVLSAKEESKTKGEAFAAGANDYLIKLPDQIELVARIRYHSEAYLSHLQLKETIHKLEEAHAQLIQSEKMASVGQLAAGVAHEINNPIGFVNSNLTTLNRYVADMFRLIERYERWEGDAAKDVDNSELSALKEEIDLAFIREDLVDLLAQTLVGIERVKKIVQDLKDFSRVDAPEWETADLHSCIESALNIGANELKYKTQIVKEYGEIPPVHCLPSQLNQVLLNLLVNAAQAIDERGTITIRTGTGDGPEKNKLPNASAAVPRGGWVFIQVSDTGEGIDAEHIQKLFDPFFTTKPVGKGTGLGLYVSYGIVQRHGGTIEVESGAGEGATFTIWLPVNQPEEQLQAAGG